ncbi:hypothetical protein HELRODRAFT_65278 [Helobdella robusta]|uniref:BPL/LPL catalytic domain-containing protein n=1 Tax=Helobdella robusta TaxID=6412 RepID=T1FY53_HELRO|nr:hypothetical protein HELRODRAFT_65278 [Helobdella robusta]ESO02413.1 hypothetical protein HELRODRAFT_65278 [Helobdella robusta]
MKPLNNFTDKPPNILIYTGSNEDTTKSYMNTYSILSQCLSRDRYVVYHLKRNQINTTPWIENTMVLILAVNKIPKNDDENVFLRYFLGGGCVISLACNFDEFFVRRVKSLAEMSGTNYIVRLKYGKWNDVSVVSGCNVGYDDVAPSILDEVSCTPLAQDSQSNNQLIVLARHHLSSGVALLSQVNFEKDASDLTTSSEEFIQLKQSNLERIEIFKNILSNDLGLNCEQTEPPALSPVLLLAPNEEGNVYAANKLFSYHFTTSQDYSSSATTSTTNTNNSSNDNNINNITTTFTATNNTNNIYFITDSSNVQNKFNLDVYKKHLRSEVLGNVVLYADVVSSTMDTLDHYLIHMPSHLGLVTIASMQTSGQGRGGNVWLSPEGCALCSLHIRLPLNSPLGQHVSCLQHLVALAIVLSVREKKGYEDIDLRIKWPNDIYFAEKLKLGGILIRSTIMQDLIHINLGCGINICNKYPTTCINDLIEQHNKLRAGQSEPLPTFTVEEFLGRLISQIDRLIQTYQSDEGAEFFELYYNYWLHNDQEVTLNSIDGPRGLINGITKFGYLSVRLEDGTIVEVHPDGNSFDMMKNLLAPKIKR